MSAKAISTCGGKAPWTLLASPLKARSVTEPVLKLETKDDDMDLSSDFKKLTLQDRALPAGKRGSTRGTAKYGADLPPSLKLLPPTRMRLQFIALANGGYSTSVGQLLLCAGGVATTTTNVASFWSAVKLARIKIWPSVGASTPSSTSNAAGVAWVGGDGNIPDQESWQVLPIGVTMTRSLTFVPPKGSLASFWWDGSSSTSNLFELYAINAGDILQVEFDVCPTVKLSNVAKTVSGATAGDVYYASLDGGSELIPAGLMTATGL